MKNRLWAAAVVCSLLLAAFPAAPAIPAAAEDLPSPVAAFKGAEGGGMFASGARGAKELGEEIEVYHVTNLNDSGEGSFRDAVSRGNRIIVFDVSGYVDLDSNVTIGHDNITILGQTAPGGGICFRSNNVKIGANNVIIRYVRFRVGAHDKDGHDTRAQDGLEITDNCQNVILDHCSVSWGTDENLTAYAVKDVTIQNSIIAESLNRSVHAKDAHSYAAIWGGVNLTIHHNLIATHLSRNPKVGTSESVAMTAGYTDDQTLVDIHNNIIYNWGDKAGYGSENGAHTYIQNNVYRPGPATPDRKRARIFELSVGQKYQTNMLGSVYAKGNIIDVDENDPAYSDAQIVNENNYQDDKHTGVYVDDKFYSSTDKTNAFPAELDDAYKAYDAQFPVRLDSAEDAYDKILESAGATLPKRDAVDTRIINDVINRTAPSGSKGSEGLLDDPTDIDVFDGRGYPELETVTRNLASYDSDADGIPDTWEDRMGLDKHNPTDSVTIGPEGYTWLEIYVEEAITNPKLDNGTVSIDSFDKIYTDSDTVTLTARSGSGSLVSSYENGVVTTEPGTVGTAIVCGYENGVLKEVKAATVDSETGIAETGTVSGSDIKVLLWNSLTGMKPLCSAYTGEGSGSTDITRVEFYCNDELISEAVSAGGVWTADVKLPTGNNVITAKTYRADGSYAFSRISHVSVTGSNAAEGWISDGAAYDGESYTLPSGSSLMQTANGDFKLVARIDSMTNLVSGVETGLKLGDIKIYKTYDENFNQVIGCSASENKIPAQKYKYLEISRTGSTVTLYAGERMPDLENNIIATTTLAGAAEAGAYVTGTDENTVSKLGMLKLASIQSNPTVELLLSEGQRLMFNGESIDVKITPDGNTPVNEIWLYLDDTPIASKEVNITSEETVSIPVSFSKAQFGTIRAYCFDENIGRGTDETTVSISQDIYPWSLTDIGRSNGDSESYASVTPDYTYKLGDSSDGIIGGTADRFAYMNQQFNRDIRMYYRSRLQNSKQFGVVFKSDLNDSCETYFFGGVKQADGTYKYQLTKRAADGGDTEIVSDVTDTTGGSMNLYFIAEKVGSTVNIYQTENGATIYKTKTLLASVETTLGDEYYMGFGAVSGEPDSGWVGLEEIGESSIGWSFDYGLDWMWQLQESNTLAPEWTEEAVGGNASGKLKIHPGNNYTSDRYILREYSSGEGNSVITAAADILLTGETPGFNIYMNAGSDNEAFKVSFADDGYIYAGDTSTGIEYGTSKWYTVEITTDQGVNPTIADITVREKDGVPIADIPDVELVPFRSQIDTKRVNITNAVFFEPIADADGVYYLDNVSVDVTDSSVQKEILGSHFWNFSEGVFAGLSKLENGAEYDGLHVITGADIDSSNKGIGGISFSKRYKMGGAGSKTSKCVYFEVPAGTTDVSVYGQPAGSSGTRSIVINDGTEHKTVVSGEQLVTHTFTSDTPTTVYIYGDSGVNLFGVAYETYILTN